MKYLLFVSICVAYIASTKSVKTSYTNKYDKIDLDAVIRNDRLLKNYVNCLLDKGKCRPEGTELKRVLPDALLTGCGKCSDSQKTGGRKIIRHLIKNKRDWWNELEAKYDPKKTYVTRYANELRAEGITL